MGIKELEKQLSGQQKKLKMLEEKKKLKLIFNITLKITLMITILKVDI